MVHPSEIALQMQDKRECEIVMSNIRIEDIAWLVVNQLLLEDIPDGAGDRAARSNLPRRGNRYRNQL